MRHCFKNKSILTSKYNYYLLHHFAHLYTEYFYLFLHSWNYAGFYQHHLLIYDSIDGIYRLNGPKQLRTAFLVRYSGRIIFSIVRVYFQCVLEGRAGGLATPPSGLILCPYHQRRRGGGGGGNTKQPSLHTTSFEPAHDIIMKMCCGDDQILNN